MDTSHWRERGARSIPSLSLTTNSGVILGQWQLFVTPATQFCAVDGTGGRLDSSIAAASANGTVAFLPGPGSQLDEYVSVLSDALNIRPLTIVGTRAPLESAWLRRDELLLFYQSGQARLWDVASGQLRRSTSRPTALELLHEGEPWHRLCASCSLPL